MYQDFAKIYDEFMQTVPYSTWADYIETVWEKHNCTPKLVFDLACGTGSLTLELSKRGYEMIGADLSPEMLEIAREKAEEEKQDILYLLQDMREFELYGTVDSIVCTCDSLNYLLEEEELLEVFRLVENYLDPKGLFVFDMNTEYKYRDVMGEKVIADTTEDAAFIWQNYYYEEEKINEYQVTFFYKEDETETVYQRQEEIHYQKAYDVKVVCDLLKQCHLKVEGVYDAFSLEPATENSERVFFVAREQRKEKENE